jgi:hypothetical protein
VLGRGLHQEHQDVDGTLVGQITDELTQRAIWRQWKRVMSQKVDTAVRRGRARGTTTSVAARR